MSAEESELAMVRRHVREGENHLARQRALVDRLRVEGFPVEEAEALLASFEDIQRQHEAHLVRAQHETEA